MAYVSSQSAVLGYGAILSIGPLVSATGAPTYTPINEITDVSFPSSQREIMKVTNFNSPAGSVEKLGGSIDYGSLSVTFNRVPTDAGQTALAAAASTGLGQAYLFKLQLPVDAAAGQTATGDLYSFHAIIKEAGGFDVSTDKVSQGKATLEITGVPTYTQGS